MDIKYLGHSSFLIRGKSCSVVTDPYEKKATGFPYPGKIEASIVTVSHDHEDHNAVSAVSGSPFIVRGAGEYEINGVFIIGITTFHDLASGSERGGNTVFRMEIDGIKLLHLGDLGHPLTDPILEEMGTIDILFVPVGGKYTIGPKEAKSVIADIEPAVIIPMHYRTPSHDAASFGDLTDLSSFLTELGKEGIVPLPKYSVTKDKIPEEQTVILLS